MPRSETIAILERLARPAFDENPDRWLFPELDEEVLHEQLERDRRVEAAH